MRTFAINTLGCKVNQYESQQIRQLLENFSFQQASDEQKPDLLIVNTCCVTHIASAKSRQCIRKAQRANPDSIVVVAGCLPAGPSAEISGLKGSISVIADKEHLLEDLKTILTDNFPEQMVNNNIRPNILENKDLHPKEGPDSMPALVKYADQTRAFLKVQDGCDGYCTYCIVPKIRQKIHNKPLKKIIQEAHHLVYAGHKEIVLTGIFLGAYGQNTVRRRKWDVNKTSPLSQMLDEVARIDGLERIRLSSLEPADVTDSLLDTICAHPNIMPHLHLPLQSGSAEILRKMCRQYTADDFIKTIEKVNRRLDRPAITTDIIVGFPTETDADFAQTIKMAEFAKFAKMHVFSYSERADTAAVDLKPKVPPAVIKQRSKHLRRLDAELSKKFRTQFAGQKVTAVIESTDPCKGRAERYFMVYYDNPPKNCKKGQIISGKLKQNGINVEA